MEKDNRQVLKGCREIAAFLGISPQTVLGLLKRPDFPAGRIGKAIIAPIPQLLQWIAEGGTERKVS